MPRRVLGLGVEAFVIDGGPHTQAARAVYDLNPDGGFIWRHTEGEMQTGKSRSWGSSAATCG